MKLVLVDESKGVSYIKPHNPDFDRIGLNVINTLVIAFHITQITNKHAIRLTLNGLACGHL